MTARPSAELKVLSERIAKGDVEALKEVFDAFAGVALAVAVRIVKDRAEAEDVVQESFMQMWRSATRYEPQRAQLSTWIISIVKSRAIDRLRARGTQMRLADSIALEAQERAAEPHSDEELHSRRSAHQVQGLLSALPSEQREVLELAYFQGLSHQEIAKHTLLPLGTVKTRVRRATLKLAELLKAEASSWERPRAPTG